MYQNQPAQRPEYVGLSHIELHAMKDRPGVLAVGKGGIGPKEILDSIETLLDRYYEDKGLSFIAKWPEDDNPFVFRKNLKIRAVALQEKIDCDAVKKGNMNIVYHGFGTKFKPNIRNADYAVGYSETKEHKYGVYFHPPSNDEWDREADFQERNEFIESLRAKQPGQMKLL